MWGLERVQLQSEQARQSRLAATVSNQVYVEAQVSTATVRSFIRRTLENKDTCIIHTLSYGPKCALSYKLTRKIKAP